ncbi:TIGR00304 family membrane protein [Thermofilum pendens]|uniref:DUF131 domain-containing protein n=1 Tax=Thermofilum pendens (strain DSM 2475 / Hrk 5) TaxID=368408 RepID=A1S0B9_THEPD|nr:DUF131 domain-containing protein [Thermofilum pendens]ABL78899.1 hypothetical protein Tpen_1502 [Thermofilum pendens Hrk 5]
MDAVFQVLIALVAASVVLVLVGFILVALSALRGSPGESKVEAGGVLVVGPIPVIFGSSPEAARKVAYLAIAIMFLSVFLLILLNFLRGVAPR